MYNFNLDDFSSEVNSNSKISNGIYELIQNDRFEVYNVGDIIFDLEFVIIPKDTNKENILSLEKQIQFVRAGKSSNIDDFSKLNVEENNIFDVSSIGQSNIFINNIKKDDIRKRNDFGENERIGHLTKEEKEKLVDYCKLQQELFFSEVLKNPNEYELMYFSYINLIFLLSEKSEMEYFDNLFKKYSLDFENVIYLWVNREVNFFRGFLAKKVLEQFAEYYDMKSFLEFADSVVYNDWNSAKKMNGLTYSIEVDPDVLLYTSKIINDTINKEHKNDFCYEKNDILYINWINLKIVCDSNLNNKDMDFIHKEIEKAWSEKLFYSLDKKEVSLLGKDKHKIIKTYEAVFNGLSSNSINYEKLKDQVKLYIREAFLRLSLEDTNKNGNLRKKI